MSDYFKVVDNCPDGALIGDSSNSKLGFHGATPVGQLAAATTLAAGDSTTTILTAVNAINAALKTYGLTV